MSMNLSSLKDKTVFITGASSGIGKACALAFAHCGCQVIGVSRHCPEGTKQFPGKAASLCFVPFSMLISQSAQYWYFTGLRKTLLNTLNLSGHF